MSARHAALLLALLPVAGCAVLRYAPLEAPEPLPPSTFGGTLRAEQRITLSRDGHSSTLQGYVEVTPSRLLLVGTSALGQRLLSVTLDGEGLRAEGALELDPRRVLVDLQLALWPAAALTAAGWTVHAPATGTRRVLRDGRPYAEVHDARDAEGRGRLWLVRWDGGYTLAIDSRPLE